MHNICAHYLQNQQSFTQHRKNFSKERWVYTNKLRNLLRLEKEKVFKNYLDLYCLNVEKKFNHLFNIDPEVSLEMLKAELTGKSKIQTSRTTINEVMHRHNKFFKRKVDAGVRSATSLQKYKRSGELLTAFMKKRYTVKDMSVSEISNSFIYWLLHLKMNGKQ